MPRQEDQGGAADDENTPAAIRKEETKVAAVVVQQEHTDEGCPNVEQIKKLKGEIKRLRQDLIMKGSKKRVQQDEDNLSDDSELDEDEKAIVRMMPQEMREMIAELEQAGANKGYIKKKIRQSVNQQKNMLMFPDSNNKAFKANYEINYSDLQFDRKLSEGGYGIVYRGRWKHTTVAIKEIKREIIEQDKLEEFKNECAVMEVIRHPNVVLFLGACTKQPNLCIILEFCSRGSLWSLLHDLSIKMNWEYRKKFALDIAKGVYYLHTNKQPILHRDLKSLNVLLDQALNCKLADFGWTRVLGKVMTSKIGTYQWMAPEVIHGFKYTEKADVFSFGVILWELATRKPPYYGIDGQVVSQRVVKEGLRPKISEKEAPGPFLDLMKRCWHEDPDKRPSFGEIIKELDAMNFKNLG